MIDRRYALMYIFLSFFDAMPRLMTLGKKFNHDRGTAQRLRRHSVLGQHHPLDRDLIPPFSLPFLVHNL